MASALSYSEKSTTVRFSSSDGRRTWYALLAAVSPALAGYRAGRLFLTPPRTTPRGEAADRLGFARPFRVGRLAAWQWGTGPAVFLAHGWGGHGAQLVSFVEPLVRRGFSVVTFDAPAHGVSPGSTASVADFADALLALERKVGSPEAVIAHSFGGLGALLAVKRGLRTRSLALVAPPSPGARIEWFRETFGVPDAVLEPAKAHVARAVGLGWDAVEPAALAADLELPGLVVHDLRDKEAPVTVSRALARAWRGATLMETEGLGHRRVLADPEVVRRVVDFVSERTRTAGASGGPVTPRAA